MLSSCAALRSHSSCTNGLTGSQIAAVAAVLSLSAALLPLADACRATLDYTLIGLWTVVRPCFFWMHWAYLRPEDPDERDIAMAAAAF
jgi:hypothetical protein